MSAGRLAAVVLAAGLSSRMRGFKPLYPAGKGPETLVERIIRTCREAGGLEAFVVIGHEAERLAPVVLAAGGRPVYNPRYAEGMFGSIQTGVAALAQDYAGLFLLPVDIPAVRPQTLRRLSAFFDPPTQDVLHPAFAGERGHPPLLAASLIPEILAFDAPGGLKALLDARGRETPERVKELPVADEAVLLDADSEEDYQALLPRLARPGLPTRAECGEILRLAGTPERAIAHGRAVAALGLAIGRALNEQRGAGLDLARIETACLVHDLAKGKPRHEAEGGRFLEEQGFFEIADLVASHRDARVMGELVTEPVVVYIADKLLSGEEPVPLLERFGRVLERHWDDPEARAAILGRRERALAAQSVVEGLIGRDLFELARECVQNMRTA
jgi:CTP:molybdopterin cytidylyltransferase MocA